MIVIDVGMVFALIMAVGSAEEARSASRRGDFFAAGDARRWMVLNWLALALVALFAIEDIIARNPLWSISL